MRDIVMLGLKLVREAIEQIDPINVGHYSRQKNNSDRRMNDLEFEINDRVLVKVLLMRHVMRFR